MRTVRRAHAITALIALALSACGREPTRPAVDLRYAHFDSLARAAGASGDVARAGALSQIALAYRGGVTPATVTVLDSGMATEYSAAVLRHLFSGPPPLPWLPPIPDMWDIVFWQEPDGARFIHVTGEGDSVSFAPDLVTGSISLFGKVDWGAPGREKRGVDGYALLAVRDSSGRCALESATVTCTRAVFTVSLEAVVQSPLWPGVPIVADSEPPHPIAATSLVVPGLIMRATAQR